MLTIHDDSSGPCMFQDDSKWKIQDDEGFNWNKYIKDERTEKWVLVAEFKQSREEEHERAYLSNVYDAYEEARRENRWSQEKECFVDLEGNPTLDPDEVDFESLVAAIPILGVWCRGLKEIPHYREKVDEEINKVIYVSLEKKKKTVGEIVDESKKMMNEVKKTTDEKLKKMVDEGVAKKQQVKKADAKAKEVVVEKQQVMEDQKKTEKEAEVLNTEVKTQIESSEMLDKSDHRIDEQCKKCMETCKACTEKDKNLRYLEILNLLK
ncbi:hypothetical protein Hanom_Chr01g00053781 [Helianthus anomalus]